MSDLALFTQSVLLYLCSPILTYVLTTRFRRRWLQGRPGWAGHVVVPAHLAACLILLPILIMTAETWWDVHYGRCSVLRPPNLPEHCWGDLHTGLWIWGWVGGFLTVAALLGRATVRAVRSQGAEEVRRV